MILSSSPQTYIQTAFREGGYILEKQEGGSERHFEAVRQGIALPATDDAKFIFTFEEAREAFIAYATNSPMPLSLRWERMYLAG